MSDYSETDQEPQTIEENQTKKIEDFPPTALEGLLKGSLIWITILTIAYGCFEWPQFRIVTIWIVSLTIVIGLICYAGYHWLSRRWDKMGREDL